MQCTRGSGERHPARNASGAKHAAPPSLPAGLLYMDNLQPGRANRDGDLDCDE